jgi:hypothetical protein
MSGKPREWPQVTQRRPNLAQLDAAIDRSEGLAQRAPAASEGPMANLCVQVPTPVLRALKIAAVQKGITLRQLVLAALKEYGPSE